MVDNLEQIVKLLKFESEDDFYYLQILQRKKENPELGSNSRVIKNYYITSEEYLRQRYDEIKKLCDMFNARASIRLNKRSYEKTAFKTMVNIANSMNNREYSFIKKSYDRAVGQGNSEKKGDKTWILDIDGTMSYQDIFEIEDVVNNARPEGKNTIMHVPSKSGFHLITKPFDSREFQQLYPHVEIHKDNPTNLYIP
jgi:hypothetical protein